MAQCLATSSSPPPMNPHSAAAVQWAWVWESLFGRTAPQVLHTQLFRAHCTSWRATEAGGMACLQWLQMVEASRAGDAAVEVGREERAPPPPPASSPELKGGISSAMQEKLVQGTPGGSAKVM